MSYRALVVDAQGGATVLDELMEPFAAPHGESVAVDVLYSSVNYKDALALTGRPGVLRSAPMAAGIDAVGVIGAGQAGEGRVVAVFGAGLGERSDGGLATRVLAPADVLLPVDDARRAAAVGTAGFTAALAVLRLEQAGVHAGDGDVLVTGAGGGVGSFAVALLAARGHRVVAATGRVAERGGELRALGASAVIDRAELTESGRRLQSGRWAAAVDSVGGKPLANVLAQTRYGGTVAACGLAADSALPGTVLPFILRAVTLAGINSVDAPTALRREAWALLAESLPDDAVDRIAPRVVGLGDAVGVAHDVLAGTVPGRVVVDVTA